MKEIKAIPTADKNGRALTWVSEFRLGKYLKFGAQPCFGKWAAALQAEFCTHAHDFQEEQRPARPQRTQNRQRGSPELAKASSKSWELSLPSWVANAHSKSNPPNQITSCLSLHLYQTRVYISLVKQRRP